MKKAKVALFLMALLLTLSLPTAGLAGARKSSTQLDTKPGPAFRTVDGTLRHIKGSIYVEEEYTGNKVQLYVSKKTRMMRGRKKPGDTIRAEITKGYFANSIQ